MDDTSCKWTNMTFGVAHYVFVLTDCFCTIVVQGTRSAPPVTLRRVVPLNQLSLRLS
jgi:hypothetical protein